MWLDNWKSGIVPGLFVMVAVIAGGWGMIQLWNNAVLSGGWMLFAAAAVVAVILLGVLSVVLPMLSRFENKPLRTIGNAFAVAFANLPRTFLLGVVQACTIFACVYFVIPVLILPCLSALVSSLLVEPMFRPYLPEDFYEIAGTEQL